MISVSRQAQKAKNSEREFEILVDSLQGFIHSSVIGYLTNPALRKLEDLESLKNIAIERLFEIVKKFEYAEDKSTETNDKKFLGFFRTCVVNKISDLIRAEQASRRTPLYPVIPMEVILPYANRSSCSKEYKGGWNDCLTSMEDSKGLQPFEEIINQEIVDKVSDKLMERDDKARDLSVVIWELYVQGMKQREIAKHLSEKVSRVAYLLTNRIKPVAAVVVRTIIYE